MPETSEQSGQPLASSEPTRSRRRIWRRIWLILLLLLLGLRGWVAARAHLELGRYRAAGHPTTLAEYETKYPTPQPPARNGHENLMAVLSGLRTADEDQQDLIPMAGGDPVPDFGQPWPDDVRQATEKFVVDNAKVLQETRQALKADYFRRPLDFSRGFDDIPSDSIAFYRRAATLIALEHALHRQDWPVERQMRAFQENLRIADSLRDEPTLLEQLVRLTVQTVALRQAQWILESGQCTSADLETLDQQLQSVLEGDAWRRAFEGEVLYALAMIDGVAPGLLTPGQTGVGSLSFRWIGFLDANRAAYLRLMRGTLAAVDEPDPRRRLERVLQMDQEADQVGRLSQIPFPLMSSAHSVIKHSIGLATRVDAGRVAVAMEHYRLDHQAYPKDLDQIVPTYLDHVPLDPFAPDPGQTLRYLPRENGYVVYSVGKDGVDDEGDFSGDAETSDVGFEVWREPLDAAPATAPVP